MITHVVLFRLPDEPSRDEAVAALRSMDGQVPQLRGLEVGANVAESERAWDVCLITRFDSPEDLAAYQVDPFHDGVRATMQRLGSESAMVDFAS